MSVLLEELSVSFYYFFPIAMAISLVAFFKVNLCFPISQFIVLSGT